MPITPEEIGRRLRFVRKRRQISQETAYAKLGRDQSTISRIESGERPVFTPELIRLADLYGQPVEWFIDPNISLEQEALGGAPLLQAQTGRKGKD